MSWMEEFKRFALKSNMVDLAIGVIIGTALNRVISSLVADVIMPPIGLFLGGVNFSSLSIQLAILHSEEIVEIKYGLFINALIDFLIISGVIFAVVKTMNKLHLSSSEVLKSRTCPECRMAIPLHAKKCPHCCSEVGPEPL